MRHLDTKQLYIQDVTASGRVRVLKCRGGDNLADMGTKPLARSFIERYKLMMGISPRADELKEEVDIAAVAVGHKLRTAVSALVSALLIQPSAGTDVVAVYVEAEKFDWKFLGVLALAFCFVLTAFLYACMWCCRKRSCASLSIPLLVRVEVTIAGDVEQPPDPVVITGMPLDIDVTTTMPPRTQHVVHSMSISRTANRNTPKTTMSGMAPCVDDGHRVRVGQNQYSVFLTCKACNKHASWLFRQSDVSFRRHAPTADLVGDIYDRGRTRYLASHLPQRVSESTGFVP